MDWIRSKCSKKFLLFIVLAVILTEFPYIRIFNTLIHETGHAAVALLGGHLHTITLLENSEGVTFGNRPIWLVSVLTSAAGYSFSSFMAFFSFWLLYRQKQILLIDILLGIMFLNMLLWVRNLFGLIWLACISILFLIIFIRGNQTIRNNLLLVIATILLVDSLKSSFEVLFLSWFHPRYAGDASNLADLTSIIPVKLWGILFFTQAILFLIKGLKKGLYKI